MLDGGSIPPSSTNLGETKMETRDEMLEAIQAILESYDDEYLTEIYDKLTETLH